MLLARDMLPLAWLAPEEIQRPGDKTRLEALADDHTRCAQRLHALLVHEGRPCSRGSTLTVGGRPWASALRLDPSARTKLTIMLAVIAGKAGQINELVRHGYRVVCVGPCEALAGPLGALGAALPDTITPNDDRELQATLSARS